MIFTTEITANSIAVSAIVPMPIYKGLTSKETPSTSDGECISVSTQDDGCFSVSVSEADCFFIKGDEGDDIEYPLPEDPIDFGKIGFLEVKCIQAHGLGEVIVIGLYQKDKESSILEVIAKIVYEPSVIGGIGKLNGIYYKENLSIYGLTYEGVDRLDGWDIESTTSDICIIAGDTTYWLDSAFFELDYTDSEYTVKAKDDPYYTETTYAPSHVSEHIFSGYNFQDVFHYDQDDDEGDQWVVQHYSTSNIAQYPELSCIVPHIISSGEEDEHEQSSGVYNVSEYTESLCDASRETLTQAIELGTTLSDWDCILFGSDHHDIRYNIEHGISILKKRNGFTVITKDSATFIVKDVKLSTIETSDVRVYISSSVYYGLVKGVKEIYTRIRNLVSDVSEAIPFYNSGIKLCFSGEFYGCVYENSFKYVSEDGSISGEISGVNTTLAGSVALTADGTALVKQEDLNPSLIP